VVAASVPRLLLEILEHAAAARTDWELGALEGRGVDLMEAITRSQPDVLVLGAGREGDSGGLDLGGLSVAFPALQVVTISGDGRRIEMYRPGGPPLTVEGSTPEELLDLISYITTPGNPDRLG
jgi:hypothetical protein